MLAILRERWDSIETRPIMMELSFEPGVLGGENKVPVAPRTPVVTPVRDRGVVTEDRVESHIGLVLVAEVFHPRVHFFLAGGVPGHLAAEGIRFSFPAGGARAHLGFEVFRLRRQALALEVRQYLNKNAAFHLSENGETVGILGHRDGCFIRMAE